MVLVSLKLRESIVAGWNNAIQHKSGSNEGLKLVSDL